MFGRQMVGQPAASSRSRNQNQGAKRFERGTGQIAALEGGKLFFQGRMNLSSSGWVPADDNARAGGMFRLGNHVGGGIVGAGRFVGQHNHFAGAGDGVDVDVP